MFGLFYPDAKFADPSRSVTVLPAAETSFLEEVRCGYVREHDECFIPSYGDKAE